MSSLYDFIGYVKDNQNVKNMNEFNWRNAITGAAIAGSLLTGTTNLSAQPVQPVKPSISVKQQFSPIVAKVIAGEAGGEGEVGMHAVANVIQNRMTHGKTAEQVVRQPRQFSAIQDVNLMNRNYREVKPIADKIASSIGSLKDITGGATNYVTNDYYAKHKNHGWLSNLRVTKVIGNHTFLR